MKLLGDIYRKIIYPLHMILKEATVRHLIWPQQFMLITITSNQPYFEIEPKWQQQTVINITWPKENLSWAVMFLTNVLRPKHFCLQSEGGEKVMTATNVMYWNLPILSYPATRGNWYLINAVIWCQFIESVSVSQKLIAAQNSGMIIASIACEGCATFGNSMLRFKRMKSLISFDFVGFPVLLCGLQHEIWSGLYQEIDYFIISIVKCC